MTGTRLAAYAGVSVTLALGVLVRALHQRANFYAVCVYLAQSNANLMILTNLILLLVCGFMLALQKLLYGPLRPIETEQLYEKAWFAVTETCLAMTIFRGEIGGWFLVMFVALVIGKVWGWIGEGRVEILEQQPPANPRLFHTRLAISLSISVLFDSYMLEYSIKTVLRQARPDMMVMFGFEFAILTILSTSTAARYAISLVEIYIIRKQKESKLEERRSELRAAREEAVRREDSAGADPPQGSVPIEAEVDDADLDVAGWEEKGRWVFYLDLTTDFLKLVVYLSFFTILLTFYGLPIHIVRDVYMSIRSFFKRIADFWKYRTATRDMNERYPDATAEEVAREDVCIICREEMRPWSATNEGAAGPEHGIHRPPSAAAERMRPKRLPCGHILHFACLRSWLERQQNCPTCRRSVLATNRIQVVPGQPQAVLDVPNGGLQGQPQQPPNQGPPGNQAAGNGVNNPRIFNFGLFRVGFGAGRGDLMQDLAQGVHDGNVGQQPAQVNGPQQIGFGIGFGRRPIHQAPGTIATPPQNEIQHQLRQLEQQIVQEIENLRNASDQLVIVRMLQGELARLRLAQANGGNNTGMRLPLPVNAFPASPLTPGQIPGQPAAQAFTPNPQIPAMGNGNPSLPDGLTLPPGWTVLPLQRHEHRSPNPQNATPTLSVDSSGISPPTPAVTQTALSDAGHSSPSAVQTLPRTPEVVHARDSNANASGPTVPDTHTTFTRDGAPTAATPSSVVAPPSWGPIAASSSEIQQSSRDEKNGLNGLSKDPQKINDLSDAATASFSGQQDKKGKAKAASVQDVDDDTD